jgi:hypothetical protein
MEEEFMNKSDGIDGGAGEDSQNRPVEFNSA